ncbi:MAG: DUF1761 domain-containing protein [Patescibacteria group bacterium]
MDVVVPINYWAILVAAVAAMMIGMFWYGPLFGKPWIKLMGFTQKQMEEGSKKCMYWSMLGNFVSNLVIAYVLAHFIYMTNDGYQVQGALLTAFWGWLGFIATFSLGAVFWEGRPVKLYFINVLCVLVTLLAMAAIIGAWPAA